MITWVYVAFMVFIVTALAVDLAMNRHAHTIYLWEALAWAGFWISLGLAFTVFIYHACDKHWFGIGVAGGLTGRQAALQYLTGYLIEESLSIDNMVVFAMVFSYFQVPRMYQHRVLFWGILGAIVMRGIMIAAGTALLKQFSWITYVFGALLVFSAIELLASRARHVDPGQNLLVRLTKRFYAVTETYEDARFFVIKDGRRAATPLFLVLLVVESTDLFFAIDSIPAVLAITQDPFLVFTSNVFAMLGLRSVYFALSDLIHKFRYLQTSLVVLLGFVGVKMLLQHHVHIPTAFSLLTILLIVTVGVTASLLPWRETVYYIASNVGGLAQISLRQARRIIVLVLGGSLVLVGVVMLVLPGPAMIVIPTGLAILATEFVWARRMLRKVKKQAMAVVSSITGGAKPDSDPKK